MSRGCLSTDSMFLHNFHLRIHIEFKHCFGRSLTVRIKEWIWNDNSDLYLLPQLLKSLQRTRFHHRNRRAIQQHSKVLRPESEQQRGRSTDSKVPARIYDLTHQHHNRTLSTTSTLQAEFPGCKYRSESVALRQARGRSRQVLLLGGSPGSALLHQKVWFRPGC